MAEHERTTIAGEAERIQQTITRDARRRALVVGCIGNLVEWYDYALYGGFATIIAAVFFPGIDPVTSLFAVFVVFGVAVLARRAGALVFAHYGDRLGRRRALAAGILLMALATAGIGMLPGHSSIGWLAPFLLVLLRAGQGMSVGGEYGARLCWWSSMRPPTAAAGTAAGNGRPALWAWPPGSPRPCCSARPWTSRRCAAGDGGWRSCSPCRWGKLASTFDCGWEETPGFRAVQRLGAVSRIPLAETLRTARRQVLVGFGVVAAVTTTFNIFFVFLPSYLATTGRIPLPRALAAALVGLVATSTVAPGFGRISDRVGRRSVLIAGALALLLLTIPAFSLVQRGKTGGLLIAYSLMGLALGTLALSSFLAELFPTRLRYSGLSLTYGLASALFGGTAPALATLLVRRTGGALLPAWYATCITAVALVGVLLSPETAHRPLDTGE